MRQSGREVPRASDQWRQSIVKGMSKEESGAVPIGSGSDS